MSPRRPLALWLLACIFPLGASAAEPEGVVLLKPDRVFDGRSDLPREGWVVLVKESSIQAAGPATSVEVPKGAKVVPLPGTTLLPGLIDAHTHVMLHSYDETPWNDQVLKEPLALRVSRANNHLRATIRSGFTTIRDLGTEGGGYADVGLRAAIEQKIIPGPRLLVSTRAIVATGSYAPKGFAPEHMIPQGAEEADGVDGLTKVVRDQMGKGADWIKVYSDAAMSGAKVRPSFTLDEMRLLVEVAESNGIPVAAHAASREGMRRAAIAKVATIEHGDEGDAEIFRLMAENKVALCPTLAAVEAYERYFGKKPGRFEKAKRNVLEAKKAGVTIVNGSDMGVFRHGDGARELELLVEAGLTPAEALRAATSTAAAVLRMDDRLGTIAKGKFADLIAVEGDPTKSIAALRKVKFVMKGGETFVDAHEHK